MNDLNHFAEVLFYLEFSFIFLPLINNSVTIGFSFLLLIISAIISSKAISNLRFFLDCNLQYFYKHLAYHLNIL